MEPEAADLRRPIGMLFVERGMVSEFDLESALEHQRTTGGKLGEILVERGLISRLDLASVISEQWEADGIASRIAAAPPPVDGASAEGSGGDVTAIGPLAELRDAVEELRELVSAPAEPDPELAARLDQLEAEFHSSVDSIAARIAGPLGRQGIFQAVESLRESVRERLDTSDSAELGAALSDLRNDLG